MLAFITDAMVFLGSALMVCNIGCFVRYARSIQRQEHWGRERLILYLPIILLVLFLFGYLAVGLFGKPDIIVSSILLGGSVFVLLTYLLLRRITAEVREKEHLEAQLSAAEESSRVKTRFLSSVSHDMRTPLNAILGLDNIALRRTDLPGETRDQLEKIGASARHLLGLINDVLDMNRIESGNLTLKREPFAFSDFLRQVNVIIQSQCDDKGLSYVHNVETPMDDFYVGDEVKLRQVLINLLGNAVKFTDAPGTITLSVAQAGGDARTRRLRFTVKDTGIGMDEEYVPKIFEAFSQENDTSSNRYGGTGLGMSITKHIIEAMGGTIDVQSRKGEGSVFTVEVPLGASDEVLCPIAPAQSEPAAVSLKGRHILIAEDVDVNAEILLELLRLEGMTADRAKDGRQAVELFGQSPVGRYDAVLMDLRMPVMDGLEAARALRSLDRPDAGAVPIIALTANAFEEDARQSLEAGMNAHLSKPIDPALLYEALKKYIR